MTEAKLFFYALALLVLGMEIFLLSNEISTEFPRSLFVFSCICFYLFYTILEYVFRFFIDKKIAVIFSVLPGILLGILFYQTELFVLLSYAAFVSVSLRVLLSFFPKKEYFFLYGCFILDAVSVCLHFLRKIFLGDYSTDKLLFLCLVVLTLSSLQQLIHIRNRSAFPFHFFLLLALLLCLLPVKKEPIDWTKAKKVYDQAVETVNDTFYSVNGIFQSNTYSSGYSSFSVTGGKLKKNNTKQLILSTGDKPYYVYKDKNTGYDKIVKKSMYLPGRNDADRESLINFLQLLYNNDIDADTAALFSRVSTMEVKYEYLTTTDLILPSNTFSVTDPLGQSLKNMDEVHKKGFTMKVNYLDIDYGNPYLMALFDAPQTGNNLSYETACSYMKNLYGTDLSSVLSKETYEEISFAHSGTTDDLLDSSGVTENMKALAKDITKDANNDYEKCRAIEAYLRQFPYNTDAVGGYDKSSTMATTEGMADIANRFLFETKEGYCIHYTASMVMLLRLNGIPARAVMGYRYDFPTATQKEYTVTSDSAHAWAEAYIDGAGWVPFEPTGVYSDAVSRSWRKSLGDDAAPAYVSENTTTVLPEDDNKTSVEEKATARLNAIKIGALVLASVATLILLIILGRILGRKIYYRFASPEKRLKMDVEDIKKELLKQTNMEFFDRGLLYDYLAIAPEEQKVDIQKTFDLYYKTVYEK